MRSKTTKHLIGPSTKGFKLTYIKMLSYCIICFKNILNNAKRGAIDEIDDLRPLSNGTSTLLVDVTSSTFVGTLPSQVEEQALDFCPRVRPLFVPGT